MLSQAARIQRIIHSLLKTMNEIVLIVEQRITEIMRRRQLIPRVRRTKLDQVAKLASYVLENETLDK